jgi:hypothetical protein
MKFNVLFYVHKIHKTILNFFYYICRLYSFIFFFFVLFCVFLIKYIKNSTCAGLIKFIYLCLVSNSCLVVSYENFKNFTQKILEIFHHINFNVYISQQQKLVKHEIFSFHFIFFFQVNSEKNKLSHEFPLTQNVR